MFKAPKGKSKLKFVVKGKTQKDKVEGSTFWSKLNEKRKSLFDNLDKEGGVDEYDYPFDDGWKCSIY